jgi:hypothetical protein
MRSEVGTTNVKHDGHFKETKGESAMPVDFEERIDDNEAASVSIGSLVGTGDMALVAVATAKSRVFRGRRKLRETLKRPLGPDDSRERLREVSKPH